MTARSRNAASRSSGLLDVDLKPLSIRSLAYKRGVTPAPGSLDDVARVREEFVEMRGLSPTLDQAVRLFQLSKDECSRIFTLLLQEGFLHQTADGRYRLAGGARVKGGH